MNNLKDYDNFLNEGWFKSDYSDMIDKICAYVSKMNISDVEECNNRAYPTYRFIIKGKQVNSDIDPYGEEPSEDDLIIEVEKGFAPTLWINNDEVPAKTGEINKIRNIIKKRKENKERDELNARLRRAMDKL